MFIQGPHGGGSHDKVFCHVESASTNSGGWPRGTVVVWDTTATTLNNVNMLGIRVTTLASANSPLTAGILDQAAPQAVNATTTHQPVILMQVFGFHDAARLDDTGHSEAAGAWTLTSGSTAGLLGVNGTGAAVATAGPVVGQIGVGLEANTNTGGVVTKGVLIRAM